VIAEVVSQRGKKKERRGLCFNAGEMIKGDSRRDRSLGEREKSKGSGYETAQKKKGRGRVKAPADAGITRKSAAALYFPNKRERGHEGALR